VTVKQSFRCRVLVPTDFSAVGLLVTEEVLSWVETRGGELLLLHVVPDIFLRGLDDLASNFIDQTRLATAYGDLRDEGQGKFSTWLPYPINKRCRTLVVVGDTATAILQVAQQEAVDVIMMRAPRRRWWRPRLAGSITDTIMRNALVPVVIWAGLEQRRVSASGQSVRRPDGQDTHQDTQRDGAWRERQSARWERPTPLQSW
jgi:nucleotide-binding universal stress UspA family protein